MKRLSLISSLAVLWALSFTGSSAMAKDKDMNLEANLNGFQEAPPISTTGSGAFKATVDAGGTSISYTLGYSGLNGTASAGYIQFGQPGVNGGILAFLCGGGGKPSCPASGTVTGTLAAADIMALSGQGIAAGDFAAVLQAIRGGVVYANVTSSLFSLGEIRGQINGGKGKGGDDDDESE